MSIPGQGWVTDNTSQAASSVPSSVGGGNSGGFDGMYADIIKNIATPIDQNLVKAAMTPIPGAHAAQVPSNMTTPIPAANQGRLIDTRGIVGHKNARAAGIGNAIIGATNAIGAVTTAMADQKQNQVRDAAQKVITAQQAIDEAQQAHDAALSSGDAAAASKAQELIQKNIQVRDGVFADPKLHKALVKGFNISYTDPGSNDSIEHKGAIAGIKAAKDAQAKKEMILAEKQRQQSASGKAAGAAFAEQQPQGLTANLQAQAQLAQAQQQRKDMLEAMKAYGPVYAANIRAQGQVNAEQIRADVEMRKSAVEANAKLQEAQMRMKETSMHDSNAIALENLRGSIERSNILLQQGDPVKVMALFNESQKNYEQAVTENQKSRQALNTELDKKPGGSRETEIRRQLDKIDAADAAAKNALTLNRNVIAKGLHLQATDERLQVPTIHVGEGVSDGGTGAANTGSSSSTDLDPRSGKPWDSRVSATDRAIVKAHYGATVLSNRVEDTIQNLNTDVKKFTRFFDREPNNSD
jgi:tetratricopeptide (TPR) repeat protein